MVISLGSMRSRALVVVFDQNAVGSVCVSLVLAVLEVSNNMQFN